MRTGDRFPGNGERGNGGANAKTCAMQSRENVVEFYGKYNTPERLQRSDVSSK